MNRKLTLLILATTIGLNTFCQTNLPVIKANSLNVNIVDGKRIDNKWTITTEIKPDVYFSNNLTSPIVFHTDIDSISVQLKPDYAYSFIILVNGKDSAYTQIKYKKTNLDVLKAAREYDYNDKSLLNSYTFTSPKSNDLLFIKEKFKLDSVAGKGNEVSKIINLLIWVNHSYKYDGTKNIPTYSTISDLMIKCNKNVGTLHCGAMAWVLRDCYLAMGFKARQVICFPKDSNDFECHSTIAVYSNNLKKWLFMDPSNCAYATNSDNVIMSFEELREAMINDKIINLNKEINRNGTPLPKLDYLDYIAKNFYAFQCFSDNDGQSISNLLLPVEYKGDFSHTVNNYPKVTKNPKAFWKSPVK
jgi:hypothetical protein